MSDRGVYTQDLRRSPCLHVRLIRTKEASGTLTGIDCPHLPSGYLFITARDIPGENRLAAPAQDVPILATSKISYHGEVVALLAGPDPATLRELSAGCTVHVESRKGNFDSRKFSADTLLAKQRIDKGDSEEGFAHASLIVESSMDIAAQEHWYPEPHSALASFEYDKLILSTGTQWPYHVRNSVAAVLDVQKEDIIVDPKETGPHLDGRIWFPSLVSTWAALAALLARTNARIELTRTEDLLYSPKRPQVSIRHRSALDKRGRLLSCEVQSRVAAGSACPLSNEILSRLCYGATGSYTSASVTAEAFAVRTNTPPSGPFAGFGLAHANLAMENHVSKICQTLDVDPVEWRRRNTLARGSVMNGGSTLKDAVESGVLIDSVMAMSDYKRKWSAYKLMQESGPDKLLRGIGLSLAWQGSGFIDAAPPGGTQSVEAILQKDGTLELATSAICSSSSIASLWKNLAAEILGIESAMVKIRGRRTDLVPDSGPSTLSRNITVISKLIERCCTSIRKLRFREALPITVRRKAGSHNPWRSNDEKTTKTGPISWAAAVAEVEIHPADGKIQLRGLWMSIDGGCILDERRARSAMLTACHQAASSTLHEEVRWLNGIPDESSFKGYSFLPLSDSPPITIDFLWNDSSVPKGIGELPLSAIPAAISQAVAQAMNASIQSLPIRADEVLDQVEAE